MASRYPTVEVYRSPLIKRVTGVNSLGDYEYEISVSRAGWYWRFVSTNGRIIADSAEGYQRRLRALQGAQIALGLKGIDQMQPGESKLVRRGSSKIRVVVLGR